MNDLLDEYAQNNGLRGVNSTIKLLIGLGSILLCVSSKSPLVPFIIACVLSITLVYLAHIPAKLYLKLTSIPLSFALISCAVVVFLQGSGRPLLTIDLIILKLGVYSAGLNMGLLIFSRTFGGMCSLFFIALTTPMAEMFTILKSAGVPEVLIELSMLIYRYIFVLVDEASKVRQAQIMRLGDQDKKRSIFAFAMLSSVLFVRAWERGERLMTAMDSRCYDGKYLTVLDAPFNRHHLIITMIYLGSMAFISYVSYGFYLI